VGILLILLFSVNLGWIPPSGYVPFTTSPLQNLELMILPSVTIAASMVGLVTRQARAAVLEVMEEEFVQTARAKGLPERRVMVAHVLRNALIPIVTIVGLQLGHLVSGAVVTETIFSLPGLGRMVVEAIFERDYTALQGAIVTIICFVIVINLLTDILYAVVDKRTADA
jgi:peptide/nickel transport system permease protein